jgi:hypothetical protein
MGLDLLDITYRLEESLGVEIEQTDFEGIVRDRDVLVGDLYNLILAKLDLRDVGRYHYGLNAALWEAVRDRVAEVSQQPAETIEPATPLAALFPRKERRDRWAALRESSPLRIPELDYPVAVRYTAAGLALGMVAVDYLKIWQFAAARWLWPLLAILGLWMLAETHFKVMAMLRPFRTAFPRQMQTMKDLCRQVLALNYADIHRQAELPADPRCGEVWETLVSVLAEVLAVEPEEIGFHSRLVHDLGAE